MVSAITSAVPGLIVLPSAFDVTTTIDRLASALAAKGIHVFVRIDHAGGAQKVNLPLRPTQVLIFGNPVAGTPLMQSNQTIGIDLPLKAVAWEDEAGRTWLGYNDPAYLAQRHGIGDHEPVLKGMIAGLESLARSAVSTTP
jgi:uncharacterized protein (DUF302 family)